MKQLRSIFLIAVLACLSLPMQAEEKEGGVNLKEILFGHVQDSYMWHVTDFAGKPVIIHLPMIFYSEHSGFHVLCSSQFEHEPNAELLRAGEGSAEGFFIQGAEDEKGRIVERVGSELVPVCFDISITKTVLVLFINAVLLVLCILTARRWMGHGCAPGSNRSALTAARIRARSGCRTPKT